MSTYPFYFADGRIEGHEVDDGSPIWKIVDWTRAPRAPNGLTLFADAVFSRQARVPVVAFERRQLWAREPGALHSHVVITYYEEISRTRC